MHRVLEIRICSKFDIFGQVVKTFSESVVRIFCDRYPGLQVPGFDRSLPFLDRLPQNHSKQFSFKSHESKLGNIILSSGSLMKNRA